MSQHSLELPGMVQLCGCPVARRGAGVTAREVRAVPRPGLARPSLPQPCWSRSRGRALSWSPTPGRQGGRRAGRPALSDSVSLFLQYGVVLDAGSSRTTVYVYQWPAEKENNTGVVSQTFKCSVKGEGTGGLGRSATPLQSHPFLSTSVSPP